MITQQKSGLDKLLKEYKFGKDRELSRVLTPDGHTHSLTTGTSGLGNSVDSSWVNDQDNYVDSLLPYRGQTSNVAIDNYVNRTYSGHVTDLYHGNPSSGDLYSHDYSH